MSLVNPRRAAALALVASALALPAVAGSAAAATVAVDQPCYIKQPVDARSAHPVTIGVSATGLPAGKIVKFELLGGAQWPVGEYRLETVPADGNVSFPWENLTESEAPVAEQHPLRVVGLSGAPVYAETMVWMATYGMKVSNAHTHDGEKVRFQFAGLASGRAIYAHYVAHGKEVFSHKMGVTTSPCGALETDAQLYPAKHSRFPRYLVQFDQRRKYSPRARPRFRHALEVGTF